MRRGLYGVACGCALLALVASGKAFVGTRDVPRTEGSASVVSALSTTTSNTYYVEKVVDGDTIDVYKDGQTVRLRLIGMDTPEVVDPRKPVQCFGKQASAEGHMLLDNQWVRLEYDSVAGTYDRYGRTLAYVYVVSTGMFYNEYMIAQGFAHEYTYESQHYTYQAEFRAAQAAAKKASLGFWSPTTCNGDTTQSAST